MLMLKCSNDVAGAVDGSWFAILCGEWAFVKFVSTLMDLVNVFISSLGSKLGVSGEQSLNLGSSDVSTSGPHVSMFLAVNSCLNSRWCMLSRMVMNIFFFSVAMFNACSVYHCSGKLPVLIRILHMNTLNH